MSTIIADENIRENTTHELTVASRNNNWPFLPHFFIHKSFGLS